MFASLNKNLYLLLATYARAVRVTGAEILSRFSVETATEFH